MKGGQYILMGVTGTELDANTAAIIATSSPPASFSSAATSRHPRNCASSPTTSAPRCATSPSSPSTRKAAASRASRNAAPSPPARSKLREKGDLRLIERHGALTGEILRLFGFNLDLAPVVDVSLRRRLGELAQEPHLGTRPRDRHPQRRRVQPHPCASKACSVAASISPATPTPRSIRITSCPSSPALARSSRKPSGKPSAPSRPSSIP